MDRSDIHSSGKAAILADLLAVAKQRADRDKKKLAAEKQLEIPCTTTEEDGNLEPIPVLGKKSKDKKKKKKKRKEPLEDDELEETSRTDAIPPKPKKPKRSTQDNLVVDEGTDGNEQLEADQQNEQPDLDGEMDVDPADDEPQTSKYKVLGEDDKQLKSTPLTMMPGWIKGAHPVSRNIAQDSTELAEVESLSEDLKKVLETHEVKKLFPVQKQVIPFLLSTQKCPIISRPSDVCVAAPTGSGKTLCYVLPIIEHLRTRIVPAVRAVIMVPVQELALQAYQVFKKYAEPFNIKVVALSSLKDLKEENKELISDGPIRGIVSKCDIVITTPGRLLDQLRLVDDAAAAKGIDFHWLGQLRFLVIDEADRMMNEQKLDWLNELERAVYYSGEYSAVREFHQHQSSINRDWITRSSPSLPSLNSTVKRYVPGFPSVMGLKLVTIPLQKILLSATLSHDPDCLQQLNLFNPRLFQASDESQKRTEETSGESAFLGFPQELTQQMVVCPSKLKPLFCATILKDVVDKSSKCICFCKSNKNAQRLTKLLHLMDIDYAKECSSYVHNNIRNRILKQFNAGHEKVRVLIASDLMARGMDIENIDVVINYDAPDRLETYIHRVGRTARAGRQGTAISVVTQEEEDKFGKLMKATSNFEAIAKLDVAFDPATLGKQYKKALTELQRSVQEEPKGNRKRFNKRISKGLPLKK